MAATVRFDNPLGASVSINVRGTKEVVDLAKETTGLVSFVHCSSGYVHCHLQDEIIREGTRISYISILYVQGQRSISSMFVRQL